MRKKLRSKILSENDHLHRRELAEISAEFSAEISAEIWAEIKRIPSELTLFCVINFSQPSKGLKKE